MQAIFDVRGGGRARGLSQTLEHQPDGPLPPVISTVWIGRLQWLIMCSSGVDATDLEEDKVESVEEVGVGVPHALVADGEPDEKGHEEDGHHGVADHWILRKLMRMFFFTHYGH